MSLPIGGFLIAFDELQRGAFLKEVRDLQNGFSDALSSDDWPVRNWEVCGLLFEPGKITHWALARKYHAASVALLWKFMLRVNEPLREEDGRSLMLRHEDLCLEPTQAAHNIFEHLDVPYTSRVEFNTFWSGRCNADRIFLKQIYEPDLRKLEGLLELDISSLSRHW